MEVEGARETRLAAVLLAWYDRHARDLPWRVGPAARAGGERPDPYRVWLSEVMLQQTTVAAVRGRYAAFLARWPRVEALAAAPEADIMAAWAGLGYYARARNLIACARAVARDHAGRFPDSEEGLRGLPGIGAYTAAAIAAIAFDRPATVVDGNVERVMARLHAVETPLPEAKPQLTGLAARLTPMARSGDYAQAVMDLGATICTPRAPVCGLCPWRADCAARRAGIAETLPRKAEKAAKPVRRGFVWLALRRDGAVLVETRPASGLLGGMLALPSGPWGEGAPEGVPPLAADWRDLGVEVRHTFTHFHLRLALAGARVAAAPGDFRPAAEAGPAMPTVMRKALRLGLAAMDAGGD
ncbi:MAG TPA: A/G-specific adenine glycosylase [Amaricoccus sp.]|uniref:A/G-specific adenine glycosylase n=1 Tax=Amaricoccus sp. TaxID=1872485 RepID=UPI002CA1BC98|nr:A/G-specific adenine glycosylase [Amaricoccus sp.]HMQ92579.1 A/G-specific adenine glycosylase [Amaricoccus sp.]HMR51256.1 A/G-specific adenine glycosylase [Amaricoccus sp.]HMR60049.1 A/G-specific adenine glycosylase [Amaricoccus sp.]HMT97994.1 A/G-specific adenine glycosylase [Amaricoccus sp.]